MADDLSEIYLDGDHPDLSNESPKVVDLTSRDFENKYRSRLKLQLQVEQQSFTRRGSGLMARLKGHLRSSSVDASGDETSRFGFGSTSEKGHSRSSSADDSGDPKSLFGFGYPAKKGHVRSSSVVVSGEQKSVLGFASGKKSSNRASTLENSVEEKRRFSFGRKSHNRSTSDVSGDWKSRFGFGPGNSGLSRSSSTDVQNNKSISSLEPPQRNTHQRSSSWTSSGSSFSFSRLKSKSATRQLAGAEAVLAAGTEGTLHASLEAIRPLSNTGSFVGPEREEDASVAATSLAQLDTEASDTEEATVEENRIPLADGTTIADSPQRVTVSPPPPPRPPIIMRTVIIFRDSLDVPLGLHIVTRINEHVDGTIMNVKAIVGGGAAESCFTADNYLEVGDRILKINGEDVVLVQEANALGLLRSTRLSLVVAPDLKWIAEHSDENNIAHRAATKLSSMLKNSSLSIRLWSRGTSSSQDVESDGETDSISTDDQSKIRLKDFEDSESGWGPCDECGAELIQTGYYPPATCSVCGVLIQPPLASRELRSNDEEDFENVAYDEAVPEAWLIGSDGLITKYMCRDPPPTPDELNDYIQGLMNKEENEERLDVLRRCRDDLGLNNDGDLVFVDSDEDIDSSTTGSTLGSISEDSELQDQRKSRKRSRARQRRLTALRDILSTPLDESEIDLFMGEDDFGSEGHLEFAFLQDLTTSDDEQFRSREDLEAVQGEHGEESESVQEQVGSDDEETA